MAEAVADQLHAFKSSKHKSRSKRRCDLCGAKQGLGVDCQPGGRPAIAAAFLSSTQLTAPEEVRHTGGLGLVVHAGLLQRGRPCSPRLTSTPD